MKPLINCFVICVFPVKFGPPKRRSGRVGRVPCATVCCGTPVCECTFVSPYTGMAWSNRDLTWGTNRRAPRYPLSFRRTRYKSTDLCRGFTYDTATLTTARNTILRGTGTTHASRWLIRVIYAGFGAITVRLLWRRRICVG